ncbi:hypothetical protein ACFCW2_06150 [Qipengyuania sp. DSG2-2]|uniref:hypothetical protein n=1 Tax=Qipengyuania sp. DGS2-2 TaxID=3349631 RepID=UPI0036D42FB8
MTDLFSPVVLQFGGSLLAILVLAWLTGKLGLGARPTLDSDEAVRLAAGQAEDGYEPVAIARDRHGIAALAQDARGGIMVLRPHGGHIAARILRAGATARILQDGDDIMLDVDCGERRFGTVVLAIEDANTWADAINRLSDADHA